MVRGGEREVGIGVRQRSERVQYWVKGGAKEQEGIGPIKGGR